MDFSVPWYPLLTSLLIRPDGWAPQGPGSFIWGTPAPKTDLFFDNFIGYTIWPVRKRNRLCTHAGRIVSKEYHVGSPSPQGGFQTVCEKPAACRKRSIRDLLLSPRLYWTSQHPRRSSDTETREGAAGFFVLSVPGGKPDSHARPHLTPDDGLHQELFFRTLFSELPLPKEAVNPGIPDQPQKPSTGRWAFHMGIRS